MAKSAAFLAVFSLFSLLFGAEADSFSSNVAAVSSFSKDFKGPSLTIAARGPGNALYVCEIGASPDDVAGAWSPVAPSAKTGCWHRIPLSRLTSHPALALTRGGVAVAVARGEGNRLHAAAQLVTQDTLPATKRAGRWSAFAPTGGPMRLASHVAVAVAELGHGKRGGGGGGSDNGSGTGRVAVAVAVAAGGDVVFTLQTDPDAHPTHFADWSPIPGLPVATRDGPVAVEVPGGVAVAVVGEDLKVYTSTLSGGAGGLTWTPWTVSGGSGAGSDSSSGSSSGSNGSSGRGIARATLAATPSGRLVVAGFTARNRPVVSWQRVPGKGFYSHWRGFGPEHDTDRVSRFAREVRARAVTVERDPAVDAALSDALDDGGSDGGSDGSSATAAIAPVPALQSVSLTLDPQTGRLYAAARTRAGAVALRRVEHGAGWTQWVAFGGAVRRDPVIVAAGTGAGIHVLAVGADGVVVHRVLGSERRWTQLGGITCD
jgi:hypothetical protein